jgi:4-diphosphocytidyl-2-C-methyl-D-erythritol kinase
MKLERKSPGKINLLLNVLGKRADGFHELETVMHPIGLADVLTFSLAREGVTLICSEPRLPVDSSNLVHRAATAFLEASDITAGLQIHLQKNIPLAAGLGGGSSNAATTLLALNELFGEPLGLAQLTGIATSLGSDIPFFLQSGPALATGRGERIQPLDFFPALQDRQLLLVYPGFGIPTASAYQQLGEFPAVLNGQPGRAARLVASLQSGDWADACGQFYNSREAPVLRKYPLLALFQEFLRAHGAGVALMSGSGSTTFGLVPEKSAGQRLAASLARRFGEKTWTALVPLKA